MNSALQCLSNTSPLNKFFVSDAYKEEINEKNPLGMKGDLAKHFGALLKAMWGGQYSCVAPKNLKSIIGKKAPQFSGYQQHDAQVLILLEECSGRVTLVASFSSYRFTTIGIACILAGWSPRRFKQDWL